MSTIVFQVTIKLLRQSFLCYLDQNIFKQNYLGISVGLKAP